LGENIKTRILLLWFVGLVAFGNGLLMLFRLIQPGRAATLEGYSPISFMHLSPFLTLVLGFSLMISSINLLKRKKRAFWIVSLLALLSSSFHVLEKFGYPEAAFSLLLLLLLVVSRKTFTVKSSRPDLTWGTFRIGTALLVMVAYGVLGFWLLEPRHFGRNFHLTEAARQTFLLLAFAGDEGLIPLTPYGRRFLESIHLISAVGVAYALFSLFRPVRYRLLTLPRERDLARKIVRRHGRHALDFYKMWPDKSLFFSSTREAFLAYRVGVNSAVALADPVGPEEEIERIILEFKTHCEENDWRIAFHQTLPDFLPVYEKAGFRGLKIGDNAMVALSSFSLDGKKGKTFRNIVHRMESHSIEISKLDPPISTQDLKRLKEVSDEWLSIAGKRERGFTLGVFDPAYIGSTTVFAAVTSDHQILGFVNLVPSFRKGEISIDLMRRRNRIPNGLMDYIFIKLFLYLKEKGYERFDLGMAPMSGFHEGEESTAEERAIHFFFQHMQFVFNFQGLKAYKAKFATSWEPRYLVYQNPLDLPRHAMALYAISEIGAKKNLLQSVLKTGRLRTVFQVKTNAAIGSNTPSPP